MDDHPGLAEEYHRTLHPTLWTVAVFDWFSDEYTALVHARSEAEAERKKAELIAARRDLNDDNLVVLEPARRRAR